jgi:hypothetical protein
MRKMRLVVPLVSAAALIPACSSLPSLVMKPTVKPEASVTHSRQSPETYYQLGRYFHAQNRVADAADAYKKALALDGRFYEAAHRLGVLYAMQGELDLAIEQLRSAVAQAPGSAHLHNNLGYTYLLKGDLAEAIRSLETAAALEPANRRTLNNLASAYVKAGQMEKARELRAQLAAGAEPGRSGGVATGAAATATPPTAVMAGVDQNANRERAREDLVTHMGQSDMVLRQVNPNIYELVTTTSAAAKPVTGPASITPGLVQVSIPQFTAAPQARALPAAVTPVVVPARAFRVEVSNGNGIGGMARRVGAQLKEVGIDVVRLTDQTPYNQAVTEVHYRADYATEAARLAALLHAPVPTIESRTLRADIHVRLVLGKDLQNSLEPNIRDPGARQVFAQR